MANTSLSIFSRHTSQDGKDYKSAYCHYVESCFKRQIEAEPYYRQLEDYLVSGSSNGTSNFQSPHYYELKRKALAGGGAGIFHESINKDPSHRPRIAVLEGFPDPGCISALGANENIRPELFIGHLGFSRHPGSTRRYFELPALPSDRSNTIHVRLITMGQVIDADPRLKSHAASRIRADEKCVQFEKQLFEKKQYGTTRFRKVHLHNSQIFSVEQVVSFSVTQRKPQSWCGTFLLDRGKTLAGRHNLPWSDFIGRRENLDLVPVIPYNSPLKDVPIQAPDTGTKCVSFASLHPYHPMEDLFIQEDEDLELLRQDPFFILSRLFLRAARSWSQVLNFVDEDVQACSVVAEDLLSPALEQLRFNASLVTRFEGFLAEDLHVIQERGDASWPKPNPALEPRIAEIQKDLLKDYGFLIGHCRSLSSRCKTGSGILVSAAQLIEAHEGTTQARQAHSLTRLAFVFIPLTFVASVFGMNVAVFKEYPSIWLYFVVAVPVTTLSWFLSVTFGRKGRSPIQSNIFRWSLAIRKLFSNHRDQSTSTV